MFVLGVGAQKAGTTWLFDQLEKQDGWVSFGKKEWHFWDRACRVRSREFKTEQQIKSFFGDSTPPGRAALSLYFSILQGHEIYSSFQGSSVPPLFADITPSYSGLPLGTLNAIAAGLQKRGMGHKAIYMLRDPVDRIVSAFGMNLFRQGQKVSAGLRITSRDQLGLSLLDYSSSWQSQFRTRYELTIANLDKSFGPAETVYAVLELLHRPDYVSSVFTHLHLDTAKASLSPVHVGSNKLEISDELRKQISIRYEPTYRFIGERFPEVQSVWKGFGFI